MSKEYEEITCLLRNDKFIDSVLRDLNKSISPESEYQTKGFIDTGLTKKVKIVTMKKVRIMKKLN